MSAQAPLPYELLLLGLVDGIELFRQVSRRLEGSSVCGVRPFELEEIITAKPGAPGLGEENRLRLRRLRCDAGDLDQLWLLVTLQRILSAREYPSVAIRGIAMSPIPPGSATTDGRESAIQIAESQGYKRQSTLRKKGHLYAIGQVHVYVYQLFAPAESQTPVQRADQWLVEVQHIVLVTPPAPVPPTRSGQPAPAAPQPTKLLAEVLDEGIVRVDEVRALLRGLVALQRVEA